MRVVSIYLSSSQQGSQEPCEEEKEEEDGEENRALVLSFICSPKRTKTSRAYRACQASAEKPPCETPVL